MEVRYVMHQKCLQDVRYHLSYLSESIRLGQPALFTEYVKWLKQTLPQYGIPIKNLIVNFGCIEDELKKRLDSASYEVVKEYLEEAVSELSKSDYITGPEETGLNELAERYLTLLLNNDRYNASKLVLDAVEGGICVKDIYMDVFQESQKRLGVLWHLNKISVAQEHYCTAATQLIMSQLYPKIFSTGKNGKRAVFASIAGELHEIGARMVADFFEMDGWDSHYLGANTPVQSIISFIENVKPHMIGISVTMSFNLASAEQLIAKIRSQAGGDIVILLGGYPFNNIPDLWKSIGADACSGNALDALITADRLLIKER
ncbi:MAG: cobalamin B12-binding domain-containing protein [Bacillota bacterium]